MVVRLCIALTRLNGKCTKNLDAKSKQKYSTAKLGGESANRISNTAAMKIGNPFKEKRGWHNMNDFFANNGTGNLLLRMPSPDKITS